MNDHLQEFHNKSAIEYHHSIVHEAYLMTNLALKLHFAGEKCKEILVTLQNSLEWQFRSCLPLSLINNLNNRHSAMCL